jgi:hypothetical protein
MGRIRSRLRPGTMCLTASLLGCTLSGLASPASASVWTSPVVVSRDAPNARGPEVVFDSAGNALAVWSRTDGSDYPYRVDAAFRPVGGKFGPVQTVSAPDQDVFPFHKDLAFDPRGNAIVVWAGFSPDLGERIWSAFRPADGSFGSPGLVSGPGHNVAPRVAFDRRGNAIAIWTRLGDSPYALTGDIQTAFRAAGKSFDGTQTLAHDVAADPTVSFDRKDNALALWAGSYVQGAFRPADGRFGSAETVANSSGSSGPQLAFDHRGNAIAAWKRFVWPYDRIQAAFRPAGGSFESPTTLSGDGPDRLYPPSLAADAKGNAIVAWFRYGDGDQRIQVAFRPAGGGFGPPETIAEVPSWESLGPDPTVAMNQRGDGVLVWRQGYGIEAALRHGDGAFSAPETIAGSGGGGLDAAIDSKGNAVAVWIAGSGIGAAFSSSH